LTRHDGEQDTAMSEQMDDQAFHEQSEVPISFGLYYLAFLLVATLTMLLIAGGVIG
jgi:translation elongation factor EF-1beta